MRDLATDPLPMPDGGDAAPGAALWWWASLGAAALAAAPAALGGAILRAGPGPARDAWLAGLATATGRRLHRLPMGCPPARLSRGVDLAALLAGGRAVAEPGLVERAAGGLLIVPGADAMGPDMAAQLVAALEALDPDRRPIVVAFDERGLAAGADEPGPPSALVEHLALTIPLDGIALADLEAGSAVPEAPRAPCRPAPAGAAAVAPLARAAAAMGIPSLRPVVQAVAAAGAFAALDGRQAIEEEDLSAAARLVLLPRARCLPSGEDAAEEPADSPPDERSPDDTPPDDTPPDDTPPDETPPEDSAGERPEDDRDDGAPDEGAEPDPAEIAALAERVLEAAVASLPPETLAALAGRAPRRAARAGRAGPAGRGAARGRPIGTRAGQPGGGRRLALVETMLAAAPWQRLRGRAPGAGERLHVRRADLRVHRQSSPTETLTIFAVDASGSAAYARLAEAKGAVEIMLGEAYRRRDSVALVAFRGSGAALLLPPTRALARARRALAGLPGGGTTPLAAGLDTAAALARRALAEGQRVQVVALTDGRGNIARDGTPGRAGAMADATAAAAALAATGAGVLVIDTGARPARQAAALAEAARGRCLALPGADARRLAAAAGAATAAAMAEGAGR